MFIRRWEWESDLAILTGIWFLTPPPHFLLNLFYLMVRYCVDGHLQIWCKSRGQGKTFELPLETRRVELAAGPVGEWRGALHYQPISALVWLWANHRIVYRPSLGSCGSVVVLVVERVVCSSFLASQRHLTLQILFIVTVIYTVACANLSFSIVRDINEFW